MNNLNIYKPLEIDNLFWNSPETLSFEPFIKFEGDSSNVSHPTSIDSGDENGFSLEFESLSENRSAQESQSNSASRSSPIMPILAVAIIKARMMRFSVSEEISVWSTSCCTCSFKGRSAGGVAS